MTQEELAAAMGVNQGVISRWERRKVAPNEEHLKELKEILK